MTADYRSVRYYYNLQKKLEKKKDFVKRYIKSINNIREGGNCIFTCSFLCCCCCSRCALDGLNISTNAKLWIASIRNAYGNTDDERIRTIFNDAINVIKQVELYIQKRFSVMKQISDDIENKGYRNWIENRNSDVLFTLQDFHNNVWLGKLYYKLYRQYNIEESIRTIQLEYSLTLSDIKSLCMAMPLFFPLMYNSDRNTYTMQEHVIEYIKNNLT